MSLDDNLLRIINVMVNIGGPTTAKEISERGIMLPFPVLKIQKLLDIIVKKGAAQINKRNRKYKLKKEFYKVRK